jgi:hypothetical protein
MARYDSLDSAVEGVMVVLDVLRQSGFEACFQGTILDRGKSRDSSGVSEKYVIFGDASNTVHF